MAKAKGEGQRRGHGEGSFRLTPNGKWEGAQWVKEVGKRVYATGDTEKQARAKLALRVREVQAGRAPARLSTYTFGEYAEKVIRERPGVGERTRDKYRGDLRLYLAPLIGERLSNITPALLRTTYAGLRKRELSDAVQGHAHTLARLVLETARHDTLIGKNPADVPGVRPKPERGNETSEIHAYDRDQSRRILEAARDVTHGELVAFLLLTGMRRGEAVGLKWEAVNLAKKTATVRETRSVSLTVYEGTPKTKQSRRDVPLTAEAVALLTHIQAVNDERRAAFYPDAPPSAYVFPTLRGTPQRPENVRRPFRFVLDLADKRERQRVSQAGGNPDAVPPLPRFRVHDLRHTFVSLAAASGVRLEVIARMIGDSTETVMRVYLHIFSRDLTPPDLGIGGYVPEVDTAPLKTGEEEGV